MLDQDESRFLEPGSRVRPRYNPADPLAGEARYQGLNLEFL